VITANSAQMTGTVRRGLKNAKQIQDLKDQLGGFL
jgi:hypothetical protein